MEPQSGTKDQFYCAGYYITLNSNCKAQRVCKILKNIVEDWISCQNQWMGDLSECNVFTFQGDHYV